MNRKKKINARKKDEPKYEQESETEDVMNTAFNVDPDDSFDTSDDKDKTISKSRKKRSKKLNHKTQKTSPSRKKKINAKQKLNIKKTSKPGSNSKRRTSVSTDEGNSTPNSSKLSLNSQKKNNVVTSPSVSIDKKLMENLSAKSNQPTDHCTISTLPTINKDEYSDSDATNEGLNEKRVSKVDDFMNQTTDRSIIPSNDLTSISTVKSLKSPDEHNKSSLSNVSSWNPITLNDDNFLSDLTNITSDIDSNLTAITPPAPNSNTSIWHGTKSRYYNESQKRSTVLQSKSLEPLVSQNRKESDLSSEDELNKAFVENDLQITDRENVDTSSDVLAENIQKKYSIFPISSHCETIVEEEEESGVNKSTNQDCSFLEKCLNKIKDLKEIPSLNLADDPAMYESSISSECELNTGFIEELDNTNGENLDDSKEECTGTLPKINSGYTFPRSCETIHEEEEEVDDSPETVYQNSSEALDILFQSRPLNFIERLDTFYGNDSKMSADLDRNSLKNEIVKDSALPMEISQKQSINKDASKDTLHESKPLNFLERLEKFCGTYLVGSLNSKNEKNECVQPNDEACEESNHDLDTNVFFDNSDDKSKTDGLCNPPINKVTTQGREKLEHSDMVSSNILENETFSDSDISDVDILNQAFVHDNSTTDCNSDCSRDDDSNSTSQHEDNLQISTRSIGNRYCKNPMSLAISSDNIDESKQDPTADSFKTTDSGSSRTSSFIDLDHDKLHKTYVNQTSMPDLDSFMDKSSDLNATSKSHIFFDDYQENLPELSSFVTDLNETQHDNSTKTTTNKSVVDTPNLSDSSSSLLKSKLNRKSSGKAVSILSKSSTNAFKNEWKELIRKGRDAPYNIDVTKQICYAKPELVKHDIKINSLLWILSTSELFYYQNTVSLLSNYLTNNRDLIKNVLRSNTKKFTKNDFIEKFEKLFFVAMDEYSETVKCKLKGTDEYYFITHLKKTPFTFDKTKESILDFFKERAYLMQPYNGPFVMKFYGSFQLDNISGLFLINEFCSIELQIYLLLLFKEYNLDIPKHILSKVNEPVSLYKLHLNFMNDKHLKLITINLVMVLELCLILDFLGKAQIMHGSITPRNIQIAPNGHLKLTDFGLNDNRRHIFTETTKEKVRDKIIHGCNCSDMDYRSNYYLDMENACIKLKKLYPKYYIHLLEQKYFMTDYIRKGTGEPSFLSDLWSVGVIIFELMFFGQKLTDPYTNFRQLELDFGFKQKFPEYNIVNLFYISPHYKRYMKGLKKFIGSNYEPIFNFLFSIFKPISMRSLDFCKTVKQLHRKVKMRMLDIEKIYEIKTFKDNNLREYNITTYPLQRFYLELLGQFKEYEGATVNEWLRRMKRYERVIDIKPGFTLNMRFNHFE